MRTMVGRRSLVAVAVLVLAGASLARAAGGGPAPAPSRSGGGPSAPSLTPEERAAQKYNAGLKQQEKADGLFKDAEAATDPKKKSKTESQARKAYEKARSDFEGAIKINARDFQAHGALGYVQRRLGDYDASLKAYDKALELKPGYTPAVEYRAEAFLGLNKIEEAKSAYMELFTADRLRADMLAAAMQKWVDGRRKDPAGVEPAALDGFAKWLEQRKEIASQTSALLPSKDAKW